MLIAEESERSGCGNRHRRCSSPRHENEIGEEVEEAASLLKNAANGDGNNNEYGGGDGDATPTAALGGYVGSSLSPLQRYRFNLLVLALVAGIVVVIAMAWSSANNNANGNTKLKPYGGNLASLSQNGNSTDIAGRTERRQPRRYPIPLGHPIRSPDYNPFWLVASKTEQVAVTIIPKVMCSSIRCALNTIECADRPGMTPELLCDAQRGPRCAEARRNAAVRTANLANYTRVAFFRDPFERSYSAYTNSKTNVYIKTKKCPSSAQCTIDEWVRDIAQDTAYHFKNEHFKPQVSVAQFDKMHYHYLLRMSSVIDQNFFWKDLLHRTDRVVKNLSSSSSSSAKGKNGTTTSSAAAVAANDKFQKIGTETMELLATVYRDDLELWDRLLVEGTPRDDSGEETTTFDLYKRQQQQIRRQRQRRRHRRS